jgi:pimeloyl-ACP methyl ester carboxylesterase
MTSLVLVHGAWHGDWAWERVTPLLREAGADPIVPNLTLESDVGLSHHVDEVVAALEALPARRRAVLVGHSYAGLVVREAADRVPERVAHLVLVEGWAGADSASMFSLAPDWFVDGVRAAAANDGGWRIPAPSPAVFGITDPADASWLEQRLRPQPLRTFADPTRLSGACSAIPGTGIYCRPQLFPFAQFAEQLGYRLVALDGPHDLMLTDPAPLAGELLAVRTE